MRYVGCLFVSLLLSGCASISQMAIDYSQVDTAFPAPLLHPPVADGRGTLPYGTYYRDVNRTYLHELDTYIAYLQRHRNAIEVADEPANVKIVPCPVTLTLPPKPRLPAISRGVDVNDDNAIIIAMRDYIVDLKKYNDIYETEVMEAYNQWLTACQQ